MRKTVSTNIELHNKILVELHKIYAEKNKKYGNSFVESMKEWGFTALSIRLTDKFLRAKQLIHDKNDKIKNETDESLRDTLMDMANYCLMGVMVLDEENERSL